LVIKRVKDSEVKWWNPVFVIPKKDGKFRKIVDCRRLN
jgi:hypothetical protein